MLDSARLPLPGVPRLCSRLALVLLSLAAAVWTPGCDKNITDRDIRGVSASEVRRLLDESKAKDKPDLVLLIDPRTPAQFQAGHIAGARNIQLDEFQSQSTRQGRIPAYERFETLVVYGNDPASTVARAMAKRLLANDYKNVYWFTGGTAEWVRTGGTLVPASPATP
ncbi:MAG: Rhodanese-like domain [Planctomycetota bacterium]|jgi:rhodanese-related sulfurtransferase